MESKENRHEQRRKIDFHTGDCREPHGHCRGECHHLAGADDFLLKVRCRSTQDLEHILIEQLRSLPIVTGTRTSVVLGTAKESASMTSIKSKKPTPRPKRKD